MQQVSSKKISVITVTYNAAHFLEATILSVLNQKYNNIEYIIIDGQSTDDTNNIIKKYSDKISYYISEPDNGVYDAMNKGVQVASGDWIYFLGAGDILLNVLDRLVLSFINVNTIYYGNVYKLDELKVYDGFFSAFKLAVKNICHQAIFYPAVVFESHRYNLKYRMQADHELNMLCYGNKLLKFEFLPVVISVYEGDGVSAIRLDFPFFL